MSKKQFVEKTVEQLEASPKKYLAGHGINSTMLRMISMRPDILSKLASYLYMFKTSKKGANGLKKSNLFQVKAYKNFNELNKKARLDVEKFMSGLKGSDAANFNNAGNIVTIVFDTTTKLVAGPEGDDVVEAMVGPSESLTFDKAVRSEYKIPGAAYVVMMYADSLVLPAAKRAANARGKQAEKKNKIQGTPAKVKAAMRKVKKLKADLAKNKTLTKNLRGDQFALNAQNMQYNQLTKRTGAKDLWSGIEAMNAKSRLLAEKRLNSADAKLFKLAMNLKDAGDEANARLILNKIKNKRELTKLMAGVTPAGGNDMIDARRKELVKKIKNAETKIAQLKVLIATGPMQKRASYRSQLSSLNKRLMELKARMNFYSKKNYAAMGGKAQQLANVRAAIESNIEEGNSISQALNAALAQLAASKAQKQQIKQQIVQQVAEGTPMQFAVQQAIQDADIDYQQSAHIAAVEDMIDDMPDGTLSFNDLMDML